MKVRDRGNKMKKENTCMIWKGGLKNITNEKQNKYVYFHSNPKINGTMTMLFITGFYPHIIFYEIRMTINLIVSPVTPYITYKS
jgi:hypothetical protein